MGETDNFTEILRKANEDGIFKGQILSSLEDIKRTLGEMKDKHVHQDSKIDGLEEKKVDKIDHKELSRKVETLQKIVWVGIGGLGLLQLIVGLAK